MSKLDDMQAQIDAYDRWINPSIQETLKMPLPDWETIARQALKVALAAQEVANTDLTEMNSHVSWYMVCKQDVPHHDKQCCLGKLEMALEEIES